MREFEWMMDSEENHYSSWYKELLKTGRSSMTEEQYKIIAGLFDDNAEENINMINEYRANLLDELIAMYGDDVEKFTGMPIRQYLMNAFPYESLLIVRY